MGARVKLEVALPGLHAARVRSDEPFLGLKESFMVSRFEAGHSRFWTHGREWNGAPGTVVVFEPGDVMRDIERSGPMTYQLLAFSSPLPRARGVQSSLDAGDPRGAPFRRLHDAVAKGADAFTLECVLTEAIGAMAALGEERHQPVRAVRLALEVLHAQLAEPVTLDALSTVAGLDKFHLCRAFRTQVGLPPHAYLTQLRILRAKALLAAGTRPRDVAPQVGLYDQSQLNRHFRRIVGVTPGQFSAKKHLWPEMAAR